jgi:competence protein ComEC
MKLAFQRFPVLRVLLCAAILSPFVAGPVYGAAAQSTTGTIQGLVRDEQQAIVPGATITVRHLETNMTRVVVTGDPRPRSGPPQPGRAEYVVEARTRWIDVEGRREASRVPVVILASGPQWHGLVPSQELTVNGRFVPAGEAGDFTAALALARGEPASVSEPRPEHRAAGLVRQRLREAAEVLPQPERGLVPALVVGDVSELPEETAEDFRVTSLTHVMVPSGAKLAIMMGVALGVAKLLRAPTWAVVAAGAVTIAVFVLLCRPEPSVLRAAVMGAIALLCLRA